MPVLYPFAPLHCPFFVLRSFMVPFLCTTVLYSTLSLCYSPLGYPFFMLQSFRVPFLCAKVLYSTFSLHYSPLWYPFFMLWDPVLMLHSFSTVPFLYATLLYPLPTMPTPYAPPTLYLCAMLYLLCSTCYALHAMLYVLSSMH